MLVFHQLVEDLFSTAYVANLLLLREKQTIILVKCKDSDFEMALMQVKRAAVNNVGSRIRSGH